MISNPKVSIITPVFNGVKYLKECIDSVRVQTYPNIEHVIVDGTSTDGSLNILREYRDTYPDKVRLISEPDRGILDATNKGLRMAKGEIFGWCASDDRLIPNAVQAVVDFFKSHSNVYFMFGECNTINEKGEVIVTSKSKDFDFNEILNKENYVSSTSTFFRREVIDKIGLYDIEGRDLDFLLRVGKVFKICRVNDVLSEFRKHGGSDTFARKPLKRKVEIDYRVSRKYGGKFFSGYGVRYFTFPLMEDLLQPKNGEYSQFQRLLHTLYSKVYLKV